MPCAVSSGSVTTAYHFRPLNIKRINFSTEWYPANSSLFLPPVPQWISQEVCANLQACRMHQLQILPAHCNNEFRVSYSLIEVLHMLRLALHHLSYSQNENKKHRCRSPIQTLLVRWLHSNARWSSTMTDSNCPLATLAQREITHRSRNGIVVQC